MLRYLTAGESHGRGLVAILEGLPAGLKIDTAFVNAELKRRQQGFGRGKRMSIEKDTVTLISGLKNSRTLGSPLALMIENRDFSIERLHPVKNPRPGHADLAGYLKYGFSDVREVLERASARSTAATVALGAVAKLFLGSFGIAVRSRVASIHGETTPAKQREAVSRAARDKDTVGGEIEVIIAGAPAGLGSYVQPDRRLDARLALAMMGIPGIKAVEIGLGFGYARARGSRVHDEIFRSRKGYYRTSNNAGGIEGGISNGEEIRLRACMKPIATLLAPLSSVSLESGRPAKASVERSDICAVEPAAVVAESACGLVIADSFLEKFGGDNIGDIEAAYERYLRRIR